MLAREQPDGLAPSSTQVKDESTLRERGSDETRLSRNAHGEARKDIRCHAFCPSFVSRASIGSRSVVDAVPLGTRLLVHSGIAWIWLSSPSLLVRFSLAVFKPVFMGSPLTRTQHSTGSRSLSFHGSFVIPRLSLLACSALARFPVGYARAVA